MKTFDKIILGAGLYGFYAAEFCAKKGERVLVIEHDDEPFSRATYVNQARVHNGYHYPRSFSTAVKSAGYFDRFNEDYGFCIMSDFRQIYATSARYSWTNAGQFRKFCSASGIKCESVDSDLYFRPGMCDGVFEAEEYTYDAAMLKTHFLNELARYPNVEICYGVRIADLYRSGRSYVLKASTGEVFATGYLLNATYASVNQILIRLGFEPFKIKYELCEIILCRVNEKLRDVGITVMDGPFFSLMPFGKTGVHSLTSVTFTPHVTSNDAVPTFDCQWLSAGRCSPQQLGNCNSCPAKPVSAWGYMSALARKYLREDTSIQYLESLFSMKPILKASEIDDSRPTVIKTFSADPVFVSVLSGKINTVYDMGEVL